MNNAAWTPVNRSSTGLILVFDLDQTLVGNYIDFLDLDNDSLTDIIVNPKAIELLRAARNSPRVDAILLLTNNSDTFFIHMADYVIGQKVAGKPVYDSTRDKMGYEFFSNIINDELFFDDKMDMNTSSRKRDHHKYLADVELMLKRKGVPTNNLANRTYFFDDLSYHPLSREIAPGHFIQITPPFGTGRADTTDYSGIYRALRGSDAAAATSGGRHLRLHRSNKLFGGLGLARHHRRRITRRTVSRLSAKKSSRRRISPKF